MTIHEEQTPHIHADKMLEYAKDAARTDKPWLLWEFADIGDWHDCTKHPEWRVDIVYRRKPRFILVNGVEVPEPVREQLKNGQEYWLADPSAYGDSSFTWTGKIYELEWFKNGLIHMTRDAAQLHVEAMLKSSRKSET